MATLVTGAKPVAWWQEPTKDQWLAWVAAWLGWTLDAFDFTIFLLYHAADRARIQRTANRGDCGLHDYVVDAAGRRSQFWLDERSSWPTPAADDLDPRLFRMQLHRRVLTDFLVFVFVPCPAGFLYGRRMAGRRGPGDGTVADPLARVYEWRFARARGVLGSCCRARLMVCFIPRSGGADCFGLASCRL